ncbi:uncharacterized protein K02A2.6-like [Octopus bimaculoides]|uniref:uncharacterized protein K02A2.6-like n=1 Tax=Octopus bimaculoides TaxID=37653 RepID=UPI00071DA6F0|nr:uncharacterized protein K02A2.6-like [Octopus bimaculoides]|eukprot:XP_014779458.1 PREDICTED: uncharacterized protein K02A2.6-like [Octopus bimaculoides]
MCHYLLPTPENILAKLNGGKIFSKLDVSDAYLQIKVNDEYSKYLTVNTHKGLYKYKRSPFGLKVAPVIFQQIMDAMLADSELAIPYMESESRDQHVEHVKYVFEKIKDYCFTLNEKNYEFLLPEIRHLGQVINRNGRRHDLSRADAIKSMPSPTNIATLQAYLELADYYQIYIPNMHKVRAPLNKLLKKRYDMELVRKLPKGVRKNLLNII